MKKYIFYTFLFLPLMACADYDQAPTKIEFENDCASPGCNVDISLQINLADVIASTLANQWNIQIAATDVAEQTGILQTAHGAFNLTLDSNADYTWLHDLQRLGLKTTEDGHLTFLDVTATKLYPIGTQATCGTVIDREKKSS